MDSIRCFRQSVAGKFCGRWSFENLLAGILPGKKSALRITSIRRGDSIGRRRGCFWGRRFLSLNRITGFRV
jgi:hypothetical protein